jgi:predicted DNA-binding transcriptional regulator YafY
VIARQRLDLEYYNRMKDEATRRQVSPQRLVHYRNNWYLDGWCHLRDDLRSFSLDAIREVSVVPGKVKDVPDVQLDETLAASYGIFSGRKVQWATLRFTAERGRYVSLEEWHPKQRARWEKDGRYVLEVPYSSEKELVMDLLKFGPEVEVVAPESLRASVCSLAERTAQVYLQAKR